MSSGEIKIDYPLKIRRYTRAHLDYLIKSQAEESIHLEFKAGWAIENTDYKKKEISKDVSAMANSDGGVVIYGLNEENHKADSYSFINGNEYSKEWLEQVINSRIKRRIPDLTIDVIRVQNKISKSIYVVKVPRSYEAPHMAADGRYYKRFNFESVRMEEYEVRDAFNRITETMLKIRPLEFSGKLRNLKKTGVFYELDVVADVQNISKSIEHTYKTIIKIPRQVYDQSSESKDLYSFFQKYERDYAVLAFPGENPLFPKEITTVVNCKLNIDQHGYEACQRFPLKLRLYYGNGVYQREYYLTKYLRHNSKLVKEKDFVTEK
ncbi:AlbA family DNA-binding domain-containing protein [Halocola ammonii]